MRDNAYRRQEHIGSTEEKGLCHYKGYCGLQRRCSRIHKRASEMDVLCGKRH